MVSPVLPLRTRMAVALGRAAAGISRRTCRGAGGIIGGRVALTVDPGALRHLSAHRVVVLVTGTNGKTTTALMLAEALRELAPVATNADGANMPDGVLAALAKEPDAPFAVLEVDEAYLPWVAEQVRPTAMLLLNLSRDQLDRVGEVRAVERELRAAVHRHGATVIANCDDVLVTSAAWDAWQPVWVSTGASWLHDSLACPRCGNAVVRDGVEWSCRCGLARPGPQWILDGKDLHGPSGGIHLDLRLPGRANVTNAALALATAYGFGVPLPQAAQRIQAIDAVAGRYRWIWMGPHTARLLLAKNPAGWQETTEILSPGCPIVIAVNGREADGRDLSWLWDVEFERLRGRTVIVSGERAEDLAVRLYYAGIAHAVWPDPLRAVAAAPAGPVELVANYTAFREIHARTADARH